MKTIYLLNIEDGDGYDSSEYGQFHYTPIEAYETEEERSKRVQYLLDVIKTHGVNLDLTLRNVVIGDTFDADQMISDELNNRDDD